MGNVRGALVAVCAVGGLLLAASLVDDAEPARTTPPAPTSSSLSATLSEQPPGPAARSAAGEVGDVPGSTRPATPGIDFTDPALVARTYLETAHTLQPEDAGRTNRRVLPYLAQDNPDFPRGIAVADAPAGQTIVAKVVTLDLVSGDEAGTARAYRATWSANGHVAESYVVLRRQDDGRWLVKQETASLQPADR